MRIQVIQDGQGKNTGIYIPMEDWTLIKNNYPDIDNLDKDIPDWQKQLLDKRLSTIEQNPNSIKPIDGLFDELDRDI